MKKFIVCDIGKNETYVFNPETNKHHKIPNEKFIIGEIPGWNGQDVVVEDAHLRSQEKNSLAQSWTIGQLRNLRKIADSKGVEILCFPQKATPKTRKVASLVNPELIDKCDKNDVESIAFYLKQFPSAYKSLKVFNPVDYETFEKKVAHIDADRNSLTEDSNAARNEKYGIKTDYSDTVVEWIKKYSNVLAFRLDEETRNFAGLELNSKKNALKPGLTNYTSDKLKFIYGVVNTIMTPTGKLRLRSDINKPPYWKYAKNVYFGISPYHMHAGVTASNYKYWKRKAGSSCKKSMSLESKNAIKNLDDVREIREAMKDSDRKLRTLWRTIRKMIVEDGLR